MNSPENKKARRLAGGQSMIGLLIDQSRHRAARVQSRHQLRRAFDEAAMTTRLVMRFAWYGRRSGWVNRLIG
jgi:hypothetical protein